VGDHGQGSFGDGAIGGATSYEENRQVERPGPRGGTVRRQIRYFRPDFSGCGASGVTRPVTLVAAPGSWVVTLVVLANDVFGSSQFPNKPLRQSVSSTTTMGMADDLQSAAVTRVLVYVSATWGNVRKPG
jgi:hypothetical protein